jgi:hypothetical protein
MKTWAMVLFSNEPYIEKALISILQVRQIGQWQDDIILMLPESLLNHPQIIEFSQQLRITLRKVKEVDVHSIIEHWKKYPSNPDYDYVMVREFMYHKFQVFDTFFKQWDVIFYLDSGAKIYGDLNRMKAVCEPDGCYYAHSDAYPIYEWKLGTQFCFDMMSSEEELEIKSKYNFNSDYFQGTMCIYDTKILEENTVDRLYELALKYPITRRMDQGILNLYFLCERNLWKQIPVKDEQGFLYDYHTRPGYERENYLILKI